MSPRGDPPGFVRVLDERTLLVPERPGNRLADSLRNILRNPHVGLLFVIPGVGDTLRVNGRAAIVTDEELLAPCAVEGKVPRLGLLIDVDEVFTHCSKAFLRAQLWDPSRYVDRGELPSSGEIHREPRPGVRRRRVRRGARGALRAPRRLLLSRRMSVPVFSRAAVLEAVTPQDAYGAVRNAFLAHTAASGRCSRRST